MDLRPWLRRFSLPVLVATSVAPLACPRPAAARPAPTGSGAGASVETLGLATRGTHGLLELSLSGAPLDDHPFHLEVRRALPGSSGLLAYGLGASPVFLPAFRATAYPSSPFLVVPFNVGAAASSGPLLRVGAIPPSLCGVSFVAQAASLDPRATGGAAFTKAARIGIGASRGGPPFSTRSHTAGDQPFAAVVGDFDGDQVPDLVAMNYLSGDVSVFLGYGEGTFAPPRSFPAGPRPTALAAADLNGDTYLDLVTASPNGPGGGGVFVLLGRGDGTLAPPVTYRAGQGPGSVAVADLNGDGVPDLAVADQLNGGGPFTFGAASVLVGLGDGTFGPPRTMAAGRLPVAVAIGDLNGDGIPDLAVATRGDRLGLRPGVSVLLGNGDATFAPWQRFPTSGDPAADSLGLAIGDLDADGTPDLAVATAAGSSVGHVAVLLGRGDGAFAAQRSFPTGARPLSVVIGDLNGDGVPDLATANVQSDDASVLRGRGDGTFAPPRNHPTGDTARSILIADLDGDLIPDLGVANAFADTVTVLLNRLLH